MTRIRGNNYSGPAWTWSHRGKRRGRRLDLTTTALVAKQCAGGCGYPTIFREAWPATDGRTVILPVCELCQRWYLANQVRSNLSLWDVRRAP